MLDHRRIDDEALYPGHVVRRMLAVSAGNAEQLRWIEVPEAALLLVRDPSNEVEVKRRSNSLRKQCARWAHMPSPPVRVMKKGPTAAAHWLVCESDICALARRRNVTLNDAPPTQPPAPVVAPASPEEDEEATIAKWCEIATRNL